MCALYLCYAVTAFSKPWPSPGDCILCWHWISMFQMGLNPISTLRSVKNPPKVNYSAFLSLCCLFLHICTASTMVRVFIWTLYALSWIPERGQTWYHIIPRKEWNAQIPKTWSDWNPCALEVQGLVHPEIPYTRRNYKMIRESKKHYLVFIYSICLHP